VCVCARARACVCVWGAAAAAAGGAHAQKDSTSKVTRLGFIHILFSTSYDLKPLYPQSLYSLINIIILCVSSVIASDSVFVNFTFFVSRGEDRMM
jgi:hypothetical protein